MATFKPILFAVSLTILVAVSSAAPKPKFHFEIPAECKGKTICNIKPKGYDEMQAYVESLLNTTFVAETLGDRIAEKEVLSPRSDWHNCPYITKTEESAYAYMNADGSAPDIIIQSKVLRQPIKIVECAYSEINVTSSEQCFGNLELSTLKMKSTCVGSNADRTLIVFDPKTNKIKKKPYSFPCCCSCKVENI